MIVDIFLTYKDRKFLFEESLRSFMENTPRSLYRLTIICDGFGVPAFLKELDVDYILESKENMGLGPTLNQALSHIDTLNKWYESSPLKEDNEKASQFVCYCQDDLLYSKNWLETLTKMFLVFERQMNLGFASGIECIEHKIKEKGPDGIIFKDWIRAANMFARRDYWMSMFPIPPFDPETRRKRAKPNDGMGSGVDWWFIRNAENSVCRSGRTCLVIPSLLKHLGYNRSTWLDRAMPESEEDKKQIQRHGLDELSRLGQELQGYDDDDDKW